MIAHNLTPKRFVFHYLAITRKITEELYAAGLKFWPCWICRVWLGGFRRDGKRSADSGAESDEWPCLVGLILSGRGIRRGVFSAQTDGFPIRPKPGGKAGLLCFVPSLPSSLPCPSWNDGASSLVYLHRQVRMSENKSGIGLAWAPKVPTLSGGTVIGTKDNSQGSVWIPENKLVDGLFVPPTDPRKLNKLLKKNVKDSAGRSWFDMPAPTITPELKKDLEILKLRNVIDPKRHFKKGDKSKALPKYFQVGTVIESTSEFFSGRLTKKERKTTLADELLSDDALKAYRKRKVHEIEEKHRPGGVEKWKIRGRQTRKRAKQRRE